MQNRTLRGPFVAFPPLRLSSHIRALLLALLIFFLSRDHSPLPLDSLVRASRDAAVDFYRTEYRHTRREVVGAHRRAAFSRSKNSFPLFRRVFVTAGGVPRLRGKLRDSPCRRRSSWSAAWSSAPFRFLLPLSVPAIKSTLSTIRKFDAG